MEKDRQTQKLISNSEDEVLKILDTDPDNGLSSSDVASRKEKYGTSEIVSKKKRKFLVFLSRFWGPIPWMIEIAAVFSAIINHWEDFWIILVLLLLNAAVSFWQEYKADNAIELLKQKLALNARVLRDKIWKQIQARELVPGDIIKVRLGEIVPADIKLISGDYLQIDESALTGESLPVEKKTGDVAFSGSVIKQGEMKGLVTSTGMNTYFGRTTKLVEEAKTQSHFQKAVMKIGNYLIVFALALVFLIILIGFFRHEGFMEIIQFSLVLMVAAIPAALPAVLSVTMAIGATALAKKEAIVSKLASIEELAGMDILCSDKTGTITKNELSVADVVPFGEFTTNLVLLFASLASEADNQDAIDNAITEKSSGISEIKDSLKNYTIKNFKPFDPVSKRTEADVHDENNNKFRVAKGAPQVILSLVNNNNDALESEVNKNVLEFAKKGYRALGVARAISDKWEYVGLIPLYDPPREDSALTIEQAQHMGVDVKMVTGDHTAIAQQIAEEVGMGNKIVPAEKLLELDDRKAISLIENSNGFAQVFPEHKYEIVELLQEKGHIVGMTGDGVNDAPALKKADAGIAVAGATDAAKSAAAIVLTKPGLSVIRVLLFITLSIITFRFYPVTALMIVLLALLNDAPIMTIAFDNVKVSATPDKWNMRITLGISTVLGIIGVFSSFGIFFIGKELFHLSNEVLQSFIYLKLSLAGQLTVFAARTKGHFWTVKPAKPLIFAVITTQIIATFIVVYGFLLPAMGWKLALFVWGYALIAFIIKN